MSVSRDTMNILKRLFLSHASKTLCQLLLHYLYSLGWVGACCHKRPTKQYLVYHLQIHQRQVDVVLSEVSGYVMEEIFRQKTWNCLLQKTFFRLFHYSSKHFNKFTDPNPLQQHYSYKTVYKTSWCGCRKKNKECSEGCEYIHVNCSNTQSSTQSNIHTVIDNSEDTLMELSLEENFRENREQFLDGGVDKIMDYTLFDWVTEWQMFAR